MMFTLIDYHLKCSFNKYLFKTYLKEENNALDNFCNFAGIVVDRNGKFLYPWWIYPHTSDSCSRFSYHPIDTRQKRSLNIR